MPGTAHWNHPYPAGADNPAIHTAIQALAQALDDVTKFGQGLWAGRPVSTPGSPGISGRFYYATDNKSLSYDYGTGWIVLVGADSGSALPSAPVNGQRFSLRVGSGATTELIPLIYDSQLADWTSDIISIARLANYDISNVSSYTPIEEASVVIPFFKPAYDAGLRLQMQMVGEVERGPGSGILAIAPEVHNAVPGDAWSQILTADDANSMDWSTPEITELADKPWFQPTVTPSRSHIRVRAAYKVTGGGVYHINDLVVQARYVS
jgi:hypothetical protein